ncbi:MAG TPA: glycosyltransferase, partial [Actinomycetota bacterium]|nr:glycosyltransferase [Actinomycetota bacterium]
MPDHHLSGEATISQSVSPAELAVVVVNFDSGEHLRNCISRLGPAAGDTPIQVVVVDNASTDGSQDGLSDIDPDVLLLENPQNRGYGRACNQGFAATDAPFVCFLNPDIVPESDSLWLMLKALADRPGVGVLGPRLVNPDGSTYPSCR